MSSAAQFEGGFTSSQSFPPTDGCIDSCKVTVVDVVSSKNATDVCFTFGDMTGQISCTKGTNEAYETNAMENIQDGMHVSVNGFLRNYQGKQQLVAYSVRPLTCDEIISHHTECEDYQLNKKAKVQGDFKATYSDVDDFNHLEATPSYELKESEQKVIDYLRQPAICERKKGVNSEELYKNLNISMKEMREIVMTLGQKGLILSAGDKYHIKATPSYVLKGFVEKVRKYLQEPPICELKIGVDRDELSKQLRIPMEEIMKVTVHLKERGYIYSIDDLHYRAKTHSDAAPPRVLKESEQKVLEYLQQPSIIELKMGEHQQELSKNLNIPMEEILETVKTLEDEGFIYSTIDDCHFKALVD